MKSVKLNAVKLLEVLKQNRESHVAEYTSAMEEYRKDAIAALKKNLKDAQNGGDIVLYASLVAPQNFTASYDTVIKMLEMSSDEIVELTISEFQQYVEDNWQWKGSFLASTSMYNAKAALK